MGGTLCTCTDTGSAFSGKKKTLRRTLKAGKVPKIKKHNGKKLMENTEGHRSSISELKIWTSQHSQRQPDAVSPSQKIDTVDEYGVLDRQMPCTLAGPDLADTQLIVVNKEIDSFLTWLNECERYINDKYPVQLNGDNIKIKLQELKDLTADLNQKRDTLRTIQEKVQDLRVNFPTVEQEGIDRLIATIRTRHHEMSTSVDERHRVLEKVSVAWQGLADRVDWLKTSFMKQMATADSFDTIRLLSAEVRRQLDECKSMLARVESQAQHVSAVRTESESLMEDCTDNGKRELENACRELTRQHDELKQRLKYQQDNLWTWSSSRKKFEDDYHKINRWCKETVMECDRALTLVRTVEDLEQQYKLYKSLSSSAHVFRSLVEETKLLGESYFPSLFAADRCRLRQQLDFLQHTFTRVSQQVLDRYQSLDDAIKSHGSLQEHTSFTEQMEIVLSGTAGNRTDRAVKDARHLLTISAESHTDIASKEDKITPVNCEVRQLEQVLQTHENMVRVEYVKQKMTTTQNEADMQLSVLEDADEKIKKYEKEITDLMRWVEQTRAYMTMRDTTIDLRDQLAAQEE